MSDLFNKCIQNGSYDVVSPGEICSMETAKSYGIDETNNYYRAGYDDLKTYVEEKDLKENRDKEVCTQGKEGKTAYKYCSLEHGIGYVRKAGYPEKCIAVGCPPGFTLERGQCKKPLQDYAISKRARCDGRWYDWFTIPNYHLGNKYYSPKVGKCYKPCPAYSVPQYAKDPVDESSAGFNAKEKLERCVARNDYMSGKYLEGSDYCPLAWIHRLTMTPATMKEKFNTELDKVKTKYKSENMNDSYETLRSGVDSEATKLARRAGRKIENIPVPDDQMILACQRLNNEERIAYAHDVCQRLAVDDTWYGRQLEEELGDGEQRQSEKTKMLKQACNALFCNDKDDTIDRFSKDPVCINNVPDVVPPDDADQSNPNPPSADEGTKFFERSIRTAMILAFIGIFGMTIYLFFSDFIWPKILRPIIDKIKQMFTGFKKTALQRKVENLAS
jgi:hypothetical protein